MAYRSPALRNYFRRILVLALAYMAAIFVSVSLFRAHAAHGIAAYALAVLPALPIIGVFWAVMRMIVEETDEFLRLLNVRACLFATGFCLTIVTIWEFLQNFDLVPPGNGGFGAAFFWFVGLGFGALYNRLTIGTSGCA